MAKSNEPIKQLPPIKAEVRQERGSRASQRLRAEGRLPAIVYGLKKEPLSVTLPTSEVVAVLATGTHIMDVILDGKAEKLLIQDVGRDYMDAALEHVDLMRIDPNQKVRVKVALEFRGTPKGAKEGGILETPLKEIEVEVLALAIPHSIRVVVDALELHQVITAKEVVLPAGAKLITGPDIVVATVRTVKEEVVAVAEAAPTEPEVIGKKKEEEGAEGAEGAAPAAPAAGGAKAAGPAKK